ncbi:MAG: hypothetical protein U0640_08240 [Phycisphaerales bacterium]
MNRVSGIGMLVVAVGLFHSATSVPGQLVTPTAAEDAGRPQPPNIAGKPNAAVEYLKIWKGMPRDVVAKMSNEADPEHEAALRDNQPLIESLLAVSEIKECDWGLDYDAGMDLLLPELGHLRTSARLFAYDAVRLLETADAIKDDIKQQKAARRLAAMWRVPTHVAGDRVLISSLVGIAISSLGEDRATELMEEQKLSVSSAQIVLNAVREFASRGDDPFGTRQSVLGEKELMLGWVRREYTTGTDAGVRLAAKFAGESISPLAKSRIESLNGEQVAGELDRLEPYYDKVLEAWDKPVPEGKAELDKLWQGLEDGEYGVLSNVLLPAFNKVYASHTKSMRDLKVFKKTLETYIANNGKLPEAVEEDATIPQQK